DRPIARAHLVEQAPPDAIALLIGGNGEPARQRGAGGASLNTHRSLFGREHTREPAVRIGTDDERHVAARDVRQLSAEIVGRACRHDAPIRVLGAACRLDEGRELGRVSREVADFDAHVALPATAAEGFRGASLAKCPRLLNTVTTESMASPASAAYR